MADQRTYIKVHDGMPWHPKFAGLSDKAFRTIVTAWCYSAQYLTDGLIPVTAWQKLVPGRGRKVVDSVTQELTDARLIEVAEGQVHLHDYLDHQRSKAQVEHVRQVRSEAGKLGGRPPKGKQNASGLVPGPESKPVSKKNPEVEEEVVPTSSQAETEAETDDDAHAADRPPAPTKHHIDLATRSVATIVGNRRPRSVRDGLIRKASQLLADGAQGEDLTTGLADWLTVPNARVTWLDTKVGDAASRREAAARPKPPPKESTRGQRAREALDRTRIYEEAAAKGYTSTADQLAYLAAVQAGQTPPDRSGLAAVIELPPGRTA